MRVYKAPAGDIDIPPVDILSLLFDDNSGQAREATKIHVDAAHPINSITKAEARTLTKRIAYIFRHRYGIGASGPGRDVVLCSLYGSPLAPVIFYGVVAAGGIYCGLSTKATVGEVSAQASSSRASLLVCSSECAGRMCAAAGQSGITDDRILVSDSSQPGAWSLSPAATAENLLSGSETLDWTTITDTSALDTTTICLLYSSGTTGLPKGVKISHQSLVASTVCTMQPSKEYQEKHPGFSFDTVAHLPMSNIAGIGLYSVNPFYMNGTTSPATVRRLRHTLTKHSTDKKYWMKKYNFDEFIDIHRRFNPAYQFSVPPIWLQVAKSDKVTNHFDGLQVASTRSAPIGFDTIKEIRGKLGKGKADIYQTWGITEATGVVTVHPWEAFVKDGTWSVGQLCPNVTLRILDESDNDVPEGEPGEMLIGGPILAQGYLNRPDADKEAFGNPSGWYRTGDVGVCKDGLIWIVDRKKELIKYKANQVAPAELEALLTSHPQLADAAVIGVWDEERQTEIPRAYVVRRDLQPGSLSDANAISGSDVADFVKSKVSSYKQLRGVVVFIEQIPKSASGKVLRKDLREMAKHESLKPKL